MCGCRRLGASNTLDYAIATRVCTRRNCSVVTWSSCKKKLFSKDLPNIEILELTSHFYVDVLGIIDEGVAHGDRDSCASKNAPSSWTDTNNICKIFHIL